MANKRTGSHKRQTKMNRVIFALCLAVVLCAALYVVATSSAPVQSNDPAPTAATADAQMSVMFIDVGQGDSSLVCFGSDDVMLIDAGDNWNTASINMELNERGITQIDVLIATHPHADHIGGMQDIIDNYEIGCIYMPNMQSDSKTYQKLMDTIEDRDIEIITAYAGESFDLGPANCTIVSPDKNADYDANNESVMLFVDYMDTEFLFTGDAEKWAEDQVLSAGYDIDADVLKVGHHGSSTSTSVDFLKSVSPGYAVISCGKDNDYGHPHSKTIDRLGTFDIGILRTDFKGDVLFLSDGHTLKTILGD